MVYNIIIIDIMYYRSRNFQRLWVLSFIFYSVIYSTRDDFRKQIDQSSQYYYFNKLTTDLWFTILFLTNIYHINCVIKSVIVYYNKQLQFSVYNYYSTYSVII